MQAGAAVLIAGPTASGKSAVALAIAARLDGVVVNADSMQVYRELRILTARPTAAEEARVPHRLYGFVPAAEAYSVGRWLADARAALAEIEASGRRPVVVGGTGLYFKALLEGLSPLPEIPEAVRAHWRREAKERGGPGLHRLLAERDPALAARLRPSDPQRLVRALEVLEATGRSLADWQRQAGTPTVDGGTVLRVVVAPARADLVRRIDARLERMLTEGALAEVAALGAQGLAHDLPAMRAHGMRPLLAHLAGDIDRDRAIRQVQAEIRRYAKRQLTWARRHMGDWQWVAGAEEAVARLAKAPAGPR